MNLLSPLFSGEPGGNQGLADGLPGSRGRPVSCCAAFVKVFGINMSFLYRHKHMFYRNSPQHTFSSPKSSHLLQKPGKCNPV